MFVSAVEAKIKAKTKENNQCLIVMFPRMVPATLT